MCRDGQIRLDKDNRLWACGAGQWGTVCSNSFDIDDAIVACRNLGYGTETSGTDHCLSRVGECLLVSFQTAGISYGSIGGASGFTALGLLECDGSEEHLLECVHSFDYLNDCDHSMDVTLECPCKSFSENYKER